MMDLILTGEDWDRISVVIYNMVNSWTGAV